ncbi:uncharacterized protein EI97DRAFT_451282 [Westerdykella ornata]|uniref:G-protein coupled receptors family 1 profile domain-containing protein n=1 Tax=Westerdykella ornata TaxID=318751 RepID=A0A6A6JG04_WESOR|nr:uncharacterized protein EI97DRAFT_451282 [Westerdykella ornata]KAF2275083.1 hypothetical protein EI97DRAFT_451282 [Westerdykella ornata]
MAPFEMDLLVVRDTLHKRYFAFPNSLDPLPPVYKQGLIPVALCAMLSLMSVTALLAFITYRLISWRRHYKEYVGYNQYVVLIYNLLLADLQQSIAFAISFHWLRLEKIIAPTAPCFIQAWFLNLGDVASGFFVLAIAIHTWLGVVRGYRLSYVWFVVVILCIWAAAAALTIAGPIKFGTRFFARAGGWCWISTEFQDERLWLHYLWVFIVEFGTMAIYGHIFVHLRGRIRNVIHNDVSKLSRATKFMIMYPAVYVLLTLPIAVGRMVAMTGKTKRTELPDAFLCVAGALLTSCGWIDALLYTLTRRVFITNELSSGGTHNHTGNVTAISHNGTRPGDDYGLQTMLDKDRVAPPRSVTIVGGSTRMGRIVERGRGHIRDKRSQPGSLREHSPTGSQDSIIKLNTNAIGIVTETDIHIESASSDESVLPRQFESRERSSCDIK